MATTTRPRVMFLCTGNSCRSQMAEGWTRHLHSESIEACSAGTNPHGIDPRAVAVMAELDIDISGHTSKAPESVSPETLDLVVTVCDRASESCPVFPGSVRVVHYGFDDPPRLAETATSDDAILDAYRRVRDEIRRFVESLPQILQQEDVPS